MDIFLEEHGLTKQMQEAIGNSHISLKRKFVIKKTFTWGKCQGQMAFPVNPISGGNNTDSPESLSFQKRENTRLSSY